VVVVVAAAAEGLKKESLRNLGVSFTATLEHLEGV
jgi:hypothetical protein